MGVTDATRWSTREADQPKIEIFQGNLFSALNGFHLNQDFGKLLIRDLYGPGSHIDGPTNPDQRSVKRCFVPAKRDTQQEEQDDECRSAEWGCGFVQPRKQVIDILPKGMMMIQQRMGRADH